MYKVIELLFKVCGSIGLTIGVVLTMAVAFLQVFPNPWDVPCTGLSLTSAAGIGLFVKVRYAFCT